jgi:hypothetical protein
MVARQRLRVAALARRKHPDHPDQGLVQTPMIQNSLLKDVLSTNCQLTPETIYVTVGWLSPKIGHDQLYRQL